MKRNYSHWKKQCTALANAAASAGGFLLWACGGSVPRAHPRRESKVCCRWSSSGSSAPLVAAHRTWSIGKGHGVAANGSVVLRGRAVVLLGAVAAHLCGKACGRQRVRVTRNESAACRRQCKRAAERAGGREYGQQTLRNCVTTQRAGGTACGWQCVRVAQHAAECAGGRVCG